MADQHVLGTADEEIVKDLVGWLTESLNQYFEMHEDKRVGYADMFMVAHNFHVLLLHDLEKRAINKDATHKDKRKATQNLRRAAVDTLRARLAKGE